MRGNYQRRRGQVALIFRSKEITDRRGNKTRTWDSEVRPATHVNGKNPHEVRVSETPSRSGKAELPGQQDINVISIRIPSDLPDVDRHSRVEWDGKTWDVAAPPAERNGTKHVRHWTLDLRQRPA